MVALDPTLGVEIRKTRPCLIVSPDEMNRHLRTVIIAPMTIKGRPLPTRIPCRSKGKAGQIVIDQLRAIDRDRLVRRLGRVDAKSVTAVQTLQTLASLFAL